jgi:translation elongation factor EF-4
VKDVFKAIIDKIPPPKQPEDDKDLLKAFLFDARFEPNRGVACHVKIMSGIFNVETVRQLISFHN